MIMSMQPESLEILEKAELPPAQARAIVRAIELEISGAKDTLATKHDILLLRGEMSVLAATLRSEMAAQRGELKAEIHATGSNIVRQLYLAVLGQMAVMLGFAYFFATNLR